MRITPCVATLGRLLFTTPLSCHSPPRGFLFHKNQLRIVTAYLSTQQKKVYRKPKIMEGNLQVTKLESDHFKSLFTPELDALLKLFNKYGYELRLAGGPVRDLLSGIKSADLDFATSATPEEMKAMFEREGVRMINMRGEKHGTITARINDKENFEITTLRIDVTTDGRHAEVAFTKNWGLDAGRRDLTINSMFLDFDGNVYDYFNGAEDLEKKLIRFVGEPSDRIQEDYLRILRYFRFYGRIAVEPNNHDPATLEAIRTNTSGLQQISGERIWVELKKILTGNHFVPLMITMLDLGMGPCMGFPKNANIEEFKMLAKRLESLHLQVNPVTFLSAFLNSEEDVKKLHARLKLSAFERDLCHFVVVQRGATVDVTDLKYYEKLLLLSNQPVLTLKQFILELLKYNGDVQMLESFENFDPPKFPVNGHMIVQKDVKRKLMTTVISKLKEHWIDSDYKLTAEQLLQLLPQILTDISSPQK